MSDFKKHLQDADSEMKANWRYVPFDMAGDFLQTIPMPGKANQFITVQPYCHKTIDQDNCDDFVLIVLPPNQVDFTSQKTLDIPISLPVLIKAKVYPSTNLCHRHRLVHSNYININSHPSIFQVFLC